MGKKKKKKDKVKTGELVRQFKANTNAVARLNFKVSAAYLLIQMAHDYISDADEELEAYGVNIHEIKNYFTVYQNAFRNLNVYLYDMIETEKGKRNLLEDFDDLRKIVDSFIKGEDIREGVQEETKQSEQ